VVADTPLKTFEKASAGMLDSMSWLLLRHKWRVAVRSASGLGLIAGWTVMLFAAHCLWFDPSLPGELLMAAEPDRAASPGSSQEQAGQPTADDRLQQLFDREWERNLKEWPTFASSLGDKRYNRVWNDLSFEAITRRQAHARDVLAELDQFSLAELSPEQRLNARLFREQLVMEIDGFRFHSEYVPIDQRGGLQDQHSVSETISFDSVTDFEDWLARLQAFPLLVEQTTALMRAGMAAGIVQPKVVMQRIPAQLAQQVVEDPTESPFYQPFQQFSADVSAADRQRLQQAAQTAIREQVVPAYRRFSTFFSNEYLPACLDGVGCWRLPDGEAYYAYLARSFTTTPLTPDAIHELGLQEVARIRQQMEQVKAEVGFSGSLTEFFEHLRTAPEFQFQSADELLLAYRAFCKEMDPQLTKLFRTLPRTPYGVEPIPDLLAPDTTAAYYRPPAGDGSRAGMFFVNTYKPQERPKYELPALSLHEAVPGHHLQIALANELTNVPEFRRFASFTAYIEGWGLYSESLGAELGAYRTPYDRFGQLTYEMWRAVRLVVDTGLHHRRWTREQAIEFFRQNAAKTELDIVNEIDRYIAWPGQALAYKIGELKLQELRREATEKLGPRFDIRDFHEVVLQSGAVPLTVLEQNVHDWINQRTKAAE
jgi:prolyl oligopeptidase